MSDLAEDDFTILEDGRPQQVRLFAPAATPRGARGAGAQPGHAVRHQREHAQGPAPEPAVGDALPRVDPARAGPAAGVLRPRHPHLALQLGEPAGDLLAHPRDAGLGSHGAARRDRRLPLARGRHARAQGARDLHRRRRHHEPGPAAGGAAAGALERGDGLPRRLPGRAPAEQHGRAACPLVSPRARGDDRRPGVPAHAPRASSRRSTRRSSTSWAASTCSATPRTTPSATAASAGSRSSSSGRSSRCGTGAATTRRRTSRRSRPRKK